MDGDLPAFDWLRNTFRDAEIRRVTLAPLTRMELLTGVEMIVALAAV